MTTSAPVQGVAAAFAELVDALANDLDVGEYLAAVCRHCVTLAGADCAVITYLDDKKNQHVASSDDRGAMLAASAPDPATGPWAQCMTSGQLISVADLRSRTNQWPWFTVQALATGFRSITVIPLGAQAGVTGALGLLGGAAPDASGILLALSLADAAAAGILLSEELRRHETSITQLQSALSSRIVIEQAKGILAERWKVTPDEAFTTLRKMARTSQRRLTDLAAGVIEGTVDILPDRAGRE